MAVDKFPVEASHIMMFARSVGDENKIYYDEEYAQDTEPGTIIAPPTFAQSSAQFDPDYFLRPKPGQPWFGSGKGTHRHPEEGRRWRWWRRRRSARRAALRVSPPSQTGRCADSDPETRQEVGKAGPAVG